MNALLILSHLAAFGLGAGLAWWLTRRYIRVLDLPDGHTALEVIHHEGSEMPSKPSTMTKSEKDHRVVYLSAFVTACLIIFGLGLGMYLFERHDSIQDRKDREYADCLTDFAQDLVHGLEAVRKGYGRLTAAQERKDAALDELFVITELVRREPPRATEEAFDRALIERVRAQAHYAKVSAQLKETEEDNELVHPKAVCDR